ncbi:hypothetical protein PBI_FLOOF_52 [Microbacterium phage Floof]|uniref:Uncharacterized protein n=1 Tax=Microbacterium phage Floof TaxID=2201433 RepID=A0A2Z4Q5Q8_9CAUD|nr:hypothetical protein PBI_FLOOF_52 [Microbacterium phage Floof]
MRSGIYRGRAVGSFGVWRRTPDGRWLFSLPVDGASWRAADMTDEQASVYLAWLCP